MKARVKFNNEVIDVIQVGTKTHLYDIENVEFLDNPQDYWEKLKHQAAISAMQGMAKRAYNAYCDDCACYDDMIFEDAKALLKDHAEAVADVCVEFATALVEKLKNE